jgi:hypothetical protein
MRRASTLVLVLAAVLLAAPAAQAKEITKVRACGLDGCVTTRDQAVLAGLTDGGPPMVPPRMQGGVIGLHAAVSDGQRTVAHFTSWWVPELRLLVTEDGTWMRLPTASAAALDRLTGGFEPFPASTIVSEQPPPPAATPAPAARTDDGGPSWLLLALAAVALLGATLWVIMRTPRARDFLAARP